MKKQWISIKCGLSRDPKHRRAMANSIWLFMHMLDLADWDSGIISDWRDAAEAEEMGMELRTLREQRRELDELGYITCTQKQRGQRIVIHNWTNPREYTGEIHNKKQGDNKTEPTESEVQGYVQGYAQGSKKNVTPTSSPKTKESLTTTTLSGEIFKLYEDEIGALTPMVRDAVNEWIDDADFPDQWIIDAIRRAVVQNKRSWAYVRAILNDWKAKGKQDTRPAKGDNYANGNGKSGNAKRTEKCGQTPANYSDADKAAAERVRQRKAANVSGVQ